MKSKQKKSTKMKPSIIFLIFTGSLGLGYIIQNLVDHWGNINPDIALRTIIIYVLVPIIFGAAIISNLLDPKEKKKPKNSETKPIKIIVLGVMLFSSLFLSGCSSSYSDFMYDCKYNNQIEKKFTKTLQRQNGFTGEFYNVTTPDYDKIELYCMKSWNCNRTMGLE